jgi:transcriptional regulator with XRE-family HTH domain
MEIFAENLRKRINDLGLTQAEAARRCDLENRRFHHYVVGDRQPDLATLVKIATVLGTTPDALLSANPATTAASDETSRLRAKLIATAGMIDPSGLRLLSLLADGVVAFLRDGGASSPPRSRARRRPKKRQR